MNAQFVHLHVHTESSLLDDAMHGVLEFYEKTKKAGVKPIVGCEFYIAKEGRFKKNAGSPSEAAFHLCGPA